jgi:thiol-disulfide isomerase/thioredoxin
MGDASTNNGPKRGLDPLQTVAWLIFFGLGGLLVFGMAQSLVPAAEAQRDSACRALRPDVRSGPAPELKLETLGGEVTTLADMKGDFVVLNFWATYCAPCIQEWPALDTLANRFSEGDRVRVVAVSLDDERAKITPFLERMALADSRVEVLWDPSQEGNAPFGSTAIPDTFFVNPAGDLTRAFVNVREWGRPNAFRCVEWAAGQPS